MAEAEINAIFTHTPCRCDLALLTVDDDAFWAGVQPVRFGARGAAELKPQRASCSDVLSLSTVCNGNLSMRKLIALWGAAGTTDRKQHLPTAMIRFAVWFLSFALSTGRLPRLQDHVTVVGYPIGAPPPVSLRTHRP